MKGSEAHEGDDGGAVGIGDDVSRVVEGGLGVDFGDDEGDLWVHAEGRGVIDDDTSGLGGDGAEFFGDATTGGEEGDIDSLEGVFGEFFDDDVFTTEWEGLSGGAGRGEEGEFGKWKITLGEAN